MGSERIALDGAWLPYRAGRPLREIPAELATLWGIRGVGGRKRVGSDNHGVLTVGAAVLERSLRPGTVAADTGEVIRHASGILETQRLLGHQGGEIHGGYALFHLGSVAALALGAQLLIDRRFPAAVPLLNLCRGWMADRLAIIRAMRCPDGQVLLVGTRCSPHDAPGKPVHFGAVLALAGQILDPLPLDRVTPWLRVLIPDSLAEPAATHPGCAFGWRKPAQENLAAGLHLLHRAIEVGALPLPMIQAAADGRRPRVAGEIYAWQLDGEYHAAAASLTGMPVRCWHSRWRSGLCETLVVEPHGARNGSGRQAAPGGVSIPRGLPPMFFVDLPIPELPGGAVGPTPPPTEPPPTPTPAPPPAAGDCGARIDRILEAFERMRRGELTGGAAAMEGIIRRERGE